MSWRNIVDADVLDEFTPGEKATLNNIGAASQLPNILLRVIRKVRSQIKAGGNPLDFTSETIPDQLVEETIAIARWKWLSGFPALKAFKTEERKKAADDAEALLKEISSSKADRPRVELPPTPDTTQSPASSTELATKPDPSRAANRKKLDGLV